MRGPGIDGRGRGLTTDTLRVLENSVGELGDTIMRQAGPRSSTV